MPVLKDEKDGALLTSRRRLFQSAGMQDEKGRSPQFSGRLNTVLCSRKLSIGTLRNYDGDDNPHPPPHFLPSPFCACYAGYHLAVQSLELIKFVKQFLEEVWHFTAKLHTLPRIFQCNFTTIKCYTFIINIILSPVYHGILSACLSSVSTPVYSVTTVTPLNTLWCLLISLTPINIASVFIGAGNSLNTPVYLWGEVKYKTITKGYGVRATNNRRSKRFCSNAVLCVRFTWQIVKTRVFRLRVIEGPNARDQLLSVHSIHS